MSCRDRSRSMTARQFATIRLIVVSIVVFAQVYLFVRIRQVIKSSRLSYRFKTFATVAVAAAIVLLFAATDTSCSIRIARVDIFTGCHMRERM